MNDANNINESHLAVLYRDNKEKYLKVKFIEIINPLKDMYELMYKMEADNKCSYNKLNSIVRSNKLQRINRGYDFCFNLTGVFQNVKFETLLDTSKQIKEINSSSDLSITEKDEQKKEIIFHKYRLLELPLSIENAYKKCKLNTNILAYSHRRIGWSMPEYKIGKDFTLQFKTNFGYGRSSYFYTKLRYKKIDIIPFSDWVIYGYANLYEIVRYSIKHEVCNSAWFDSMNYAKEAINLFHKDKDEFIDKYIIEECENMVSGLEYILLNNKFKFKKYDGSYYNKIFNDKRILLEYRSEKVSGALKFISKIIKYKRITNTDMFVKKIIKLNIDILPIITNEIYIINSEIYDLEKKRDLHNGKFDKKIKKYNNLKKEFKNINKKKFKKYKKKCQKIKKGKIYFLRVENIPIDKLKNKKLRFNRYESKIQKFLDDNKV